MPDALWCKLAVCPAQETPRLAVVDLDWANITAVDILSVMRSFAPEGGAGEAVVNQLCTGLVIMALLPGRGKGLLLLLLLCCSWWSWGMRSRGMLCACCCCCCWSSPWGSGAYCVCVRACVRACVRVYVDWARTTICLHAHPQEPGLRATLFHTRYTHIYRMCVRM
jgi:hypothetical protein